MENRSFHLNCHFCEYSHDFCSRTLPSKNCRKFVHSCYTKYTGLLWYMSSWFWVKFWFLGTFSLSLWDKFKVLDVTSSKQFLLNKYVYLNLQKVQAPNLGRRKIQTIAPKLTDNIFCRFDGSSWALKKPCIVNSIHRILLYSIVSNWQVCSKYEFNNMSIFFCMNWINVILISCWFFPRKAIYL